MFIVEGNAYRPLADVASINVYTVYTDGDCVRVGREQKPNESQ
jgi:hypothetical protein